MLNRAGHFFPECEDQELDPQDYAPRTGPGQWNFLTIRPGPRSGGLQHQDLLSSDVYLLVKYEQLLYEIFPFFCMRRFSHACQ